MHARATAMATPRLASLRPLRTQRGFGRGDAGRVRVSPPPRPQEAEAAQQTGEVVAEREVQRGRGPQVAVGVVHGAWQRGPRAPRVPAHALPAVEAVLLAVVSHE